MNFMGRMYSIRTCEFKIKLILDLDIKIKVDIDYINKLFHQKKKYNFFGGSVMANAETQII